MVHKRVIPVDYMNRKTGLRIEELRSLEWKRGEVNIISANLDDPTDLRLYAGTVHSTDGSACWTDLLSASAIPNVATLTRGLNPQSAFPIIV